MKIIVLLQYVYSYSVIGFCTTLLQNKYLKTVIYTRDQIHIFFTYFFHFLKIFPSTYIKRKIYIFLVLISNDEHINESKKINFSSKHRF